MVIQLVEELTYDPMFQGSNPITPGIGRNRENSRMNVLQLPGQWQ
jgi:hypothetical protein